MWNSNNNSARYSTPTMNSARYGVSTMYNPQFQPTRRLTAAEKNELRYEQGDISTPSNAQLKAWGITRDQYRTLYSKAAADFKALGGKSKGTSDVNEINQFLKKQMVATNGAYANPVLGNTITPVELSSEAGGGGGTSVGGGGGYSASSNAAAVEPIKYYTADELAKRFGIVNDYATILKEMQDATTAKFDETETTMRRAEASNLRSQESAYNQYLQDLRSRSANAVASGATKGTMAANALTSLLGFQESNRESTNLMNDLLYDIAQQRGTFLKEDAVEARRQANEIGQYLGNLSTSMDTNAINKYAAELAAQAQTRAASIGASGNISAARASANSAYDQILNAFRNDYLNKGYSAQQANALKYTSYADLIRNQYPAK